VSRAEHDVDCAEHEQPHGKAKDRQIVEIEHVVDAFDGVGAVAVEQAAQEAERNQLSPRADSRIRQSQPAQDDPDDHGDDILAESTGPGGWRNQTQVDARIK
jgi:hypothetical protein